jgi:hypothetical protein
VRLAGAGRIELEPQDGARPWRVVLSTEDPAHAVDPRPVSVDLSGPRPVVVFARPGAVVLEG